MASEPSKHAASARKGKAVEHLTAASCILASGGELNASTSLVDDEGVAARSKNADFGPVWLVPSHEFAAKAQHVGATKHVLRMSASAKPASQDQWRPFRLAKDELASAILAALDRLQISPRGSWRVAR
jgi:hypothetical protein